MKVFLIFLISRYVNKLLAERKSFHGIMRSFDTRTGKPAPLVAGFFIF
jgi:hypothetical protein